MQMFNDARGQLTPQSEVGSTLNSNSSKSFMIVLVTCKNEDPITNEGSKVVKTLSITF